jgi:hypothetical protein
MIGGVERAIIHGYAQPLGCGDRLRAAGRTRNDRMLSQSWTCPSSATDGLIVPGRLQLTPCA